MKFKPHESIILILLLPLLLTLVESGYIGCYKKLDLKDEKIIGNVHECLNICDKLNIRYAALKRDKCYCDDNVSEEDKLSYSLCSFRCSKNKSQYCGGVDTYSYYVLNDVPKIINRTETSLTIEWDFIRKKHGITEYTIKAEILNTYAKQPFYSAPEFVVASDQVRFEITNLHPGTEYNITLTAKCGSTICDIVYIKDETLIDIPDPEPKPLEIVNTTKTTRTVKIEPTFNNNGPITSYRIVVEKLDQQLNQKFDESLLGTYYQSIDYGTNYYIAGEKEFTNTTELFIVGDGKTYNGFYNPPLPENSHVHISLGLVSERYDLVKVRYGHGDLDHEQSIFHGLKFGELDKRESSVTALWIACATLSLLLVLSILSYFYLRFKTKIKKRRLSENHELHSPMGDLENHGYVGNDSTHERSINFRTELNSIIKNMDTSQRFPRNAIRLNVNDILGNGDYGEIISGTLYTESGAVDSYIHVVSDDMNKDTQISFLQDFQNLTQVMPHKKFINFLGISASPDWIYLLFEKHQISLKEFLLGCRSSPMVHEGQILQMIHNISLAMEYLEVNQICHKNLSSYNIFMINDQPKIKLIGPQILSRNEGRQVDISRWCAPEVLIFKNYSIKSDIWSFGIVAWEICTLGATPYSNITSEDLIPRIRNGVRPEQPQFVFNDIYQLFLNCWQLEPEDRITFEETSISIKQMLTSPTHILNFGNNGNTNLPYYLPLLELQN